jgi:hypothetical protein
MVKYIVALTLLGHGAGHALGFLAAWTDLPMGFREDPWIFGGDVNIQTPVGRAFGLLWFAALAGFIGAALGLLLLQEWWGVLAVAGSVISVLAILPWWSTVTPGPRLWALLVDAVVLIGLLGPWKDEIAGVLE